MEDERLLLLVDGLDEWTDETAALTTSNLLQTFIQLRNLPAVLVSRPHGFERVSIQGGEWQVGHLAPLSNQQQRQLVSKWLLIHRSRAIAQSTSGQTEPTGGIEEVGKETEECIRKLAKSSDLVQLAEVPLTLLREFSARLSNKEWGAISVRTELPGCAAPRCARCEGGGRWPIC